MTERIKYDGACMPAREAIVSACVTLLGKARPKMVRMNWNSMLNLLMGRGTSWEPDYIEEESRAYFVLWLPTGRLLAYYDPDMPTYPYADGTGPTAIITCAESSHEVEVSLAW